MYDRNPGRGGVERQEETTWPAARESASGNAPRFYKHFPPRRNAPRPRAGFFPRTQYKLYLYMRVADKTRRRHNSFRSSRGV